jgi:Phosphodiester glycosidase
VDGSRFPSSLGISRRRLRPEGRPGRRSRRFRIRVKLPGGAATTLHVLSFDRTTARPRVVAFERPVPLARWCEENGERHALVGGFFVRPQYAPLGELRLQGAPRPSVPFDPPWNRTRACVHIDEGTLRMGPRDGLGPEPAGDLLQAGPLLVADGRRVVSDDEDPEGFSAGAHQFDSDITAGRYPRAALAVTRDRLLAVACDGRTRRDAGMTLPELADALLALGAEAAINLDGGGSASLVHQGRLRNRPREAHGVDLLGGRPVVTAIVFAPD